MIVLQILSVIETALSLHLARLKYFYLTILVALMIVCGGAWWIFFAPAVGFPVNQPIIVTPGTSAAHEAALLREGHYIHSTLLFRLLFRFMPGTHGVQVGKYVFTKPVGELAVAWNLAHGVAGVPTVRVTFPEGTTVRQMGAALEKALPAFSAQKFDSLALGIPDSAEGYLFPDTYFFLPGTTEQEALDILRGNFDVRTKQYADDIEKSGHSEHDVLVMASLLEGEGKTLSDRRIIAGILWKRIATGMRLQVDAPFGYLYGLTGYTPTAADLASNSAYNTYRMKGLPPTPINNPGEESIEAAVTPTKSDYLYYLTGDDGQMHYAKTFAEHVANKKKYLK